jgi:hypothetical protein
LIAFTRSNSSQEDSGNRMQGGMEQKMRGWPLDLLGDRESDRIIT